MIVKAFIRIDPVKLAAVTEAGWREISPVDRERLMVMADERGGWYSRLRRTKDGRLQVFYADVMLVDVPLADVARRDKGDA